MGVTKHKRSYTAVCEHDFGYKVIRGKRVLAQLGEVTMTARYVLRGVEDEVNNGDVFECSTLIASSRLLLSLATDLQDDSYTLFTVAVNTLLQHWLGGGRRRVFGTTN